MNYYVYALLNPKIKSDYMYNNIKFVYKPFYIGYGIGRRIKEHYYPSLWNGKNKFKEKIIKELYNEGYEPCYIKIFENIDERSARKKEIEIISDIGLINLTNITKGGEVSNNHGKLIAQYDLDGNFIKKHNSLRSIYYNHNIIVPSKIVDTNNTRGGFLWRSVNGKIPKKINGINKKEKKSVIIAGMKNKDNKNRDMGLFCFSIDGNFIKKYKRKKDAEKEIGMRINFYKDGKLRLFSNKYFFLYGYQIKSTDNIFNQGFLYTNGADVYNKRNRKKVTQMDDKGNIINIFESIKEAINAYGTYIRKAVKYKIMAYGYYWKI